MELFRRLIGISAVVLASSSLLLAADARAQDYRYHLYVDRDVIATTGCSQTIGATLFDGAELRLTANVTGTTVTSVTRAECVGGSFSSESTIGGPHPVGLNNGTSGADVIELSVDRSLLGGLGTVRIAVAGTNGSGTSTDALAAQPGGAPILQVLSQVAIPTLGVLGLVLLIGALLFVASRRLKLGVASLGALLMAGSVWAANFIVDGQVGDWAGVAPLATDAAGDATGADPGADLIALFAAQESSRVFYRIDVRDVENQTPVALAQSRTFNEDSGANAITLTATDGDGDALTYAIVTNPTKGVLSGLNPTTGAVTYTPNLNAEGADSFTFTVNDGLATSAPATVSITLTPINDDPVINDVVFSTAENTPNGTLVGTPLPATDPDTTAPNNTLSYAITAGNTGGAFAINASTGQLTVANSAALDFKLNPSFNLTVTVSDAGIPPRSDTAAVTVNLTNVNEPPVFQSEPYVFALPENSAVATVVGQTPALDQDTTAPNNTLTWAITSGNGAGAFAINATTGAITVANSAPLNFESTPTFTLGISVTDGGTPVGSDTSSVTINLTDVNEAPVVTGGTFSLPENSANATPVGTATVTDVDLPAQTFTWSITAGDPGGAFAIAANGAITVANSTLLNFETTPTFTLTVQATDNGTPNQSGTATVTVNLTNVNEAPVFQAEPYTANVAENTPNGTTVTSVVTATDVDAATTLTYAITGGNTSGAFAIAPTTGVITVANSAALDVKVNPSFTLNLSVTDNGAPILSDTSTITITIGDVNEAPVFQSEPYAFSIAENSAPATAVGTTPATDQDLPAQTLTWAITGGNTGGTFAINPATGAITVAISPDFETTPSYTLAISVTDSGAGNLSDTSSVTITVTNVNEAPVNSVPATQTTGTGVPIAFTTANGNALSIVDVDAGTGAVTTTISTTLGTFSASAVNGATVTGSGTNSVAITDIVADVNLTLQTLSFSSGAGGSATVTVLTNDNGNTGSGGALTDTDTFTINIDAAPTVTLVTPANAATSQSGNTNLTVTFSEAVNVTGNWFQIVCTTSGTRNVADTVVSGGPTAFTINPNADFVGSETCTTTIFAAQIDDQDAIDPPANMAANFVWAFTMDAAPTVTAFMPLNGATNQAGNTNLTVTFSEPVNVTGNWFQIVCTVSGTRSVADTVVTGGPTTFTINPNADFAGADTCTTTVFAAQVADVDGNDPPDTMAANFVASFSTDAAPTVTALTPNNGATNQATNANLTVTFSEAVNVSGNWFQSVCATSGTRNVADTVVSGGPTTFTINPNVDFAQGEVCTTTVFAAQVADQDGNDPPDNMPSNFISAFTTDVAPSVTATTPANGGTTLVAADMSVTFSEAVNVSGNWFQIVCSISGTRNVADTVVSGGPTTFTINPNVNFTPGDSCTATVFAAQVADQDAGDAPDTMGVNFVWSFTTDLAPTVTATTPTNGATNQTVNTNLTITFSESVSVTGNWFQIVCPTSGTRNVAATVVTGGPTVFTINPNVDFATGETCTTTVFAAQVTDVDAADPPDLMTADFVFSFTTTDVAPTYTGGTPSGAIANNATITINFSESVNIAAGGITWACAPGFTPSLPQNGVTTITLTPTGTLTSGPCNVTLESTLVTDADVVDPPNQLDGDNSGDVIDGDADDRVLVYTVDAAPSVTAVAPINGTTAVAVTANVDVTFSEAVSVVGSWFQIVCPISGTRTTANTVVSGGPTTYTINPNVDFSQGENCVLTVFAAQINDNDAVDPPQNLAADFTSNFTTVDLAPQRTTGTAPGTIANNATITLNFSESVNIAAGGITWACSTFTPALPQNGVTTITLTPTGTLPNGAACNVTLESTLITDADAVDPPNQLDGDNSGDAIDGDADDQVIAYTVDAAPAFTTSTPTNAAVNVLPGANIIVNFSEAVDVTVASFTINCGAGNLAYGISGSGTSAITLDPTVDLLGGTVCTVTGVPASINDSDTVDPPANPAAFNFSFTVASVANDDAYPVTRHLTLTAPAAAELDANDQIGGGAITGFGTTLASANGTAPGATIDDGVNGTFIMNANGTFTFFPPANPAAASTDFFYTVTGGDTASITFTYQSELVWFVDDNATGTTCTGDNVGTQACPATTLGAVAGVDTTNDTIFVFPGNQTATITLEAGERLIGDGATGTLAAHTAITPVTGSAFPPYSNVPPVISCAGTCLTLGTGNTLRGFTIADSGAGGTDVLGNAFGSLSVNEVALSGNGRALSLTTGTMNGNFIDIDVTSSTVGGMHLNAVSGTWTVTNLVSIANITGVGINVVNSTATTNLTLVSGATVAITGAGNGIVVTASNAAAVHSFGLVAVTTSNGTGLLGNAAPITVNGGANTLVASGGPALDVTNVNFGAGASFATVSSTGSTGKGVNIDTVTGPVTMSGGAISTPSGIAFDLNAGNANVTYAGTITSTAATRLIEVTNRTGGTTTFSGNLSGTGGTHTGINIATNTGGTIALSGASKSLSTGANAAVTLATNTGATINFTGGGLTVLTTTGKPFTATGGGTVSVTGAGNTLLTEADGAPAGGFILELSSITSTGIAFATVSGHGGASTIRGVTIHNVGGAGGVTLGGGTIASYTQKGIDVLNSNNISLSGMTLTGNGTANLSPAGTCGDDLNGTNTNCAAGIDLQNVSTVSLSNVTVSGGAQIGINGRTVSGLTMNTVQVSGAGNEALEDGVQFAELTGTNTLTSVNFNNNASRQLAVQNSLGTGTLNVTGSSFTNTVYPTGVTTPSSGTAAQGLLYSGHGTANMTLNVQNSTFSRNFGAGVFSDTANSAVMNFTVNGGTISGNGLAIQVAGVGSGAMNYTLSNATITVDANAATGPISFFRGAVATGNWTGSITGNVIGTAGVPFSGSPCTSCVGMIIENAASGAGTHNVTISGNTIRQTGHTAIDVRTSGTAAAPVGNMNAKILNNNIGEPAQAGDSAIQVLAGDSVAGDTSNVCADVSGNTITNGANAWNAVAFILMGERNVNVLRLPGFAGGNGAAAGAFVAAQNSAVATTIVAGTDGTIGGGATCF